MDKKHFFSGLVLLIILSGCATQLPQQNNETPIATQPENNEQQEPELPEQPNSDMLEEEPLYENQNNVQQNPELSEENSNAMPPAQNDVPVLYNLGLNFGPWNKQTNKAGDFIFAQGFFNNKIFLESASAVEGSNGPKLIPEITFTVPNGTKIFSPVNGKIFRAEKIYSGDYTVHIQTSENSQWLVSFEHLENLKVQQGDTVMAGDVLGEASTWGGLNDFAFTELVVWKGGATEKDIVKACPINFLAQEVRADYEEKIRQLAKDWEEYTMQDIYDESAWFAPGCLRESITEFEALNPNSSQ